MEVNKYVDDNSQEEALNARKIVVLGYSVRVKQAIQFQNVLLEAEEKGMKVNTKKTNLICISDSLNCSTCAYRYLG